MALSGCGSQKPVVQGHPGWDSSRCVGDLPGVRFIAPLDGPARSHPICSHRPLIDVIIMPGLGSTRGIRAQVVGVERASGQVVVHPRHPVPRLATVEVSGWSDTTGATLFPGGERGRQSVSRCRALCLLNSGGLHQRPEVSVGCLLLGVGRLGEATQKHRRSNDVLASSSELRGVVPLPRMLRWTRRA